MRLFLLKLAVIQKESKNIFLVFSSYIFFFQV